MSFTIVVMSCAYCVCWHFSFIVRTLQKVCVRDARHNIDVGGHWEEGIPVLNKALKKPTGDDINSRTQNMYVREYTRKQVWMEVLSVQVLSVHVCSHACVRAWGTTSLFGERCMNVPSPWVYERVLSTCPLHGEVTFKTLSQQDLALQALLMLYLFY